MLIKLLIVFYVVNLLWWPYLLFFSLCVAHWTRNRVKINAEELYWKKPFFSHIKSWGYHDPSYCWYILDFGAALVCVTIICAVESYTGNGLLVIYALVGLAAFWLIPRYFVDVLHSIRYNHKTKDSERLQRLEKEIALLKQSSK